MDLSWIWDPISTFSGKRFALGLKSGSFAGRRGGQHSDHESPTVDRHGLAGHVGGFVGR